MKTQAEVDAYLSGVERWNNGKGDVAEPTDEIIGLYTFKATLDFSKHPVKFLSTTSDMAYKPDHRGIVDDRVTWEVELEGFGKVYLHLYCTPDVEDMGTWAEFWFANEPWWDGDDPYECTWEQMEVVIRGLPEDHKARYFELACRDPELKATFEKKSLIDHAPEIMNPPKSEDLLIDTMADANAYLDAIRLVSWKDETGWVADPGPAHSEFYDFKSTIDLADRETAFLSTNSDMAYKKDERGYDQEDITWLIDFPGFGKGWLHLYCMEEVEYMGYWGEFWLADEPWWNGHDPYECTSEQIAVLVRALPPEHRAKFEELASRSPEIMAEFYKSGILEQPAPAP